jgi:hypothetical protein
MLFILTGWLKNKTIMNFILRSLKGLVVLSWLLLSLYFGVSGYLTVDLLNLIDKAKQVKSEPIIVDETEYENRYAFLYAYNYENTIAIFPYLKKLPDSLALIITAMAFGALGGVTRILKQMAFENISIDSIKFISIPLVGMLSGIFILGVTYVIPTILVSGDQKIRPETLVFLSLFSGLFSKRFYDWLSTNFNSIFKNKEK